MHSIIHAKGSDIYSAFVHGAEEGYNRSTDNYVEYEKCLAKSFSFWLETTGTPKQIRAIKRKTKGDWRNAYLPLAYAMTHHHKAGKKVEEHARVYLPSDPSTVVDIPMRDWKILEKFSSILTS
jgi:hypothetical protein